MPNSTVRPAIAVLGGTATRGRLAVRELSAVGQHVRLVSRRAPRVSLRADARHRAGDASIGEGLRMGTPAGTGGALRDCPRRDAGAGGGFAEWQKVGR
jgi:hypothetical protein